MTVSITNLFYAIIDGNNYLALVVIDKEGVMYYASLGTSKASLVPLMMNDFKAVKSYRLNSLATASEQLLKNDNRILVDKTIAEFASLMNSESLKSTSNINYCFIFGTSLQRKVWKYLIEEIPLGTVSDYSTIAKKLNMSVSSSRAIGNCVGSNRLAIIVPCHRVLSKSKSLNGYRYGLKIKQYLLQAELGSNYSKHVKV